MFYYPDPSHVNRRRYGRIQVLVLCRRACDGRIANDAGCSRDDTRYIKRCRLIQRQAWLSAVTVSYRWEWCIMMGRGTSGNDAPLYNIGSVARLAGVPTATLRNWETRYGIPQPTHTSPGGHRLYTPAEAALAQLLAARVAAGTPIGKAAAAVAAERRSPAVLAAALEQGARRLDAGAVRRVLADANAILAPEEVWAGVVAPTLRRLGAQCAATGQGVSVEHLTSNVVDGWLRGLLSGSPDVPDGPTVVVACGPGERHELSSLLFTWKLRIAGVRTTFLGADTPLSALAEAWAIPQTAMLCVTALMAVTAASSAEAIAALEAGTPPARTLAYAGPGFAEAATLHERLRGHAVYLGSDLQDAVSAALELYRGSASTLSSQVATATA